MDSLKGKIMHTLDEIKDHLEEERKNGKELAVKLVDHLIVMGAGMCNLHIETEQAKYKVTVQLVSE